MGADRRRGRHVKTTTAFSRLINRAGVAVDPVTMNTYAHVIPAMQHEAAGYMDAALGDRDDGEDEDDES